MFGIEFVANSKTTWPKDDDDDDDDDYYYYYYYFELTMY